MAEICKDEKTRLNEASQAWQKAADEAVEAAETLVEETSLLDESTWGTVGGAAAVAAACLSNPFSWLICGIGVVGGGAVIVGSEMDRWREIHAAEDALNDAKRERDQAMGRFYDRLEDMNNCQAHAIAKALREN